MSVECNIEARSLNHRCSGKAISITYSVFVSVALVILHATRMRRVILLSVACLALQYFFSTLSHKRHDLRKHAIEYKMCILIFSTNLFQIFLVPRRTERGIIKNVYRSSCTEPALLVRF